MDKRWLNPKQAAEYLGMNPHSLSEWRRKYPGDPCYPKFSRIGKRHIRYDRLDLDRYMEAGKQ